VNGRIALGSYRLHRPVIHSDDFTGVHDFNRKSCGGGMASQLGPQVILVSDE